MRSVANAKKSDALKTGALLMIIVCFAISAALRASETFQTIDIAGIGSSISETFRGAFGGGSSAPKENRNATRMAADEAAILSGDIATATTKEDKAHGEGGVAMDGSGGHDGEQSSTLEELGPRLGGSTGAVGDAAKLLEALRKREAELDLYSERLRQRELELDAATKRINERIGELERSKEEFAALVASVDQASERDVEHLVEMYSKMKPKEAAALFDAMEPSFAAGFLGRMRADKASAIMSKMDTNKAYVVSLELAGRNVQRRAAGQ